MKEFFSSDLHLFHYNVIKFSGRPFLDIDEMHDELILQWNSVVSKEDTVYLLGDVSLGNPQGTRDILDRLNGKIILIRGNHEKVAMHSKVKDRFFEIKDYLYLKLIQDNIERILILSHYPFASWNRMHHGSFHLHGHTHGSYFLEKGKILDVGVDGILCKTLNVFRPLSLEEVITYMADREILTGIDHHN